MAIYKDFHNILLWLRIKFYMFFVFFIIMLYSVGIIIRLVKDIEGLPNPEAVEIKRNLEYLGYVGLF